MENALTFAERARLIKKKYSKYGEDPIAIKSLTLELGELSREQEQYKKDFVDDQNTEDVTNQYKNGGHIKYLFGGPEDAVGTGTLVDPFPKKLFNPNDASMDPLLGDDFSWTKGAGDFMNRENRLAKVGSDTSTDPSLGSDFSWTGAAGDFMDKENALAKASPAITDTKIAPTKVGYAGLLGGVGAGLAALQKEQTTTLQQFNPSLVDSTAQENLSRDSINNSYNSMKAESRETALSSGQRLGNAAAVESGRMRQLNTTLNAIRANNDNVNAGIKNQMGTFNTQIKNQEIQFNEQNEAAAINAKLGFADYLGKSMAQRNQEQNTANTVDKQNQRILNLIASGAYRFLPDGSILPNTK